MTVIPADPVLTFPSTVKLTAHAFDAEGREISGLPASWSSADTTVATISAAGLVVARAEGATDLNVTIAGVGGGTHVSVIMPTSAVVVEPARASIPRWGTQQLTVTATGADGLPLSTPAATWSVDDASLAAVNAEGLVSALAPGTVTVTATVRGVQGRAVVTIGPAAVASVEVRQFGSVLPGVRTTVIPLRATEPFEAVTYDVRGNVLTGRAIVWSSSDSGAMEVDATGLVRAVGTGGAVIRATTEGVSSPGVELKVLAMPALTGLAVGDFRSCAVGTTGEAYCWGSGTLGGETMPSGEGPVQVAGERQWAQLSTGDFHTCGITSAGAAYCWGSNDAGQLGDGTTTGRPTPAPVVGGLSFQAISAGSGYTCAVTTSHEGWCWGRNVAGQLGTGTTSPSLVPIAVEGGHAFETISTSRIELSASLVTCGVTTAGAGYCWGANRDGQLGTGDSAGSVIPREIAGGHQWAEVSASNVHACGRAVDGSAWCWGANPYGAFGNGTLVSDPRPTRVNGGPYRTISAGYLFTCAVESAGALVCFGMNEGWQLGIDGPTQSELPVRPAAGLTFVTARAGRAHACGLTTGGVAYCWGGGGNGSDGIGTVKTPLEVVGQP
ncbi:MAG TPA: Ig-like domain-containing protein [Gemmatimonadales bacterium]|nr:Ig-like domain-containing protein [Gemmatimonadales bacterium]